MNKQKILIPLDGSEFSRQILTYVEKHFDPAQYELMLLQVSASPRAPTARPPRAMNIDGTIMPAHALPMYEAERDVVLAHHPIYKSQAYESAIGILSDEIHPDESALKDRGYTVTTSIRFGDPARDIVETVNTEGIDLVAMTTHGRSGLSHILLGSVAEYVIRHVSVPVFLLRPTED